MHIRIDASLLRDFRCCYANVASCVHDVRTVDAERIDITVDSIKRYYSNVPRNATEIHRPRDTSPRVFYVLVSWYFSLLSGTRVTYPSCSRIRAAYFAKLQRDRGYLACTQMRWHNGWEVIPHFLAAKSASMARLDCAFHVQCAANVRLSPFLSLS